MVDVLVTFAIYMVFAGVLAYFLTLINWFKLHWYICILLSVYTLDIFTIM